MGKTGAIILSLIFTIIFAACQRGTPAGSPEPAALEDQSPAPALSEATIEFPATATPAAAESPSQAPMPTQTPAPTQTPVPVPVWPRFEPGTCQFYPAVIANVECGYLYVPENRSEEDTGEIQLHVAVARSNNDDPQPDPLIVLSGGPGSWALEWTYWNLRRYGDILQERDVIFFDPRGVGFSNPSLDCPEVMTAFNEIRGQAHSGEEFAESIREAHLACRERLLDDGIDLSAYNSAEMAADVNDLRTALGYDMVNLFGVSYGTRTALTVMRDYPEMVRSVVLDSAIPLEVDLLGEDAAGASQALSLLFERCAADSDCNAAYPDLESAFDELAERLDANPITIPVTHLVTNKRHGVWVDGSILGAAVLEALYNYETLVTVPQLIYETLNAENEDYGTLATSLEIFLFYGDYASEGMRQSVLCSDEGSFSTLDSALEKTAAAHPAIAAYVNRDLVATLGICDGWGAKTADPLENEPVFSDIPTLVLAGEYDPATPPAFGKQVAENLANAAYVEFPGLGHYVFADRECARDITAEFLTDPHTPPDLGCIDKLEFHFVVKQ